MDGVSAGAWHRHVDVGGIILRGRIVAAEHARDASGRDSGGRVIVESVWVGAPDDIVLACAIICVGRLHKVGRTAICAPEQLEDTATQHLRAWVVIQGPIGDSTAMNGVVARGR